MVMVIITIITATVPALILYCWQLCRELSSRLLVVSEFGYKISIYLSTHSDFHSSMFTHHSIGRVQHFDGCVCVSVCLSVW